MTRPLFYIFALFANAAFWALHLLGNYADYTEGSPIFLKKPYEQLFIQNRFLLIGAELIFPALMLITFSALIFVKMRPRPVRLPFLFASFMAMEFWMARAFLFPDRLVRYYQLSDPDFYMHLPQSDPFLWFFLAHLIVFALLIAVREYTFPNQFSQPIVQPPKREF